jgi:hypothetical protein
MMGLTQSERTVRFKKTGIKELRDQINELEDQISEAVRTVRDLYDEIDRLEAEELVQVVFVASLTKDLKDLFRWGYIDGTTKGLRVGQHLSAPTRFGKRDGLVVAIGSHAPQDDGYNGPWETLRDSDLR